jgi:replication-associated recombination protein RarA
MPGLADKYRPGTWDAVVGQDKVVATFRRIIKRGEIGGRAFWFSGKSGTGKTTCAHLVAQEIADEWNTWEGDAADLTADVFRRIECEMGMYGIPAREGGKTGRAWIVNEAHGLNAVQVRKLLTLLEPKCGLPAHVVFCFTTTVEGQKTLFEGCDDASPLLSRCFPVSLAQQSLSRLFAERAKQIAEAEGLDGQPIERYVRLVQEHKNNLRAVLQVIDSGEMLS